MDRKTLNQIQAVLAQADAAKSTISGRTTLLREQVNVKKRFGSAYQQRPWAWIGGSVALGFVAHAMARSRRNSRKKIKSASYVLAPPKKSFSIKGILWSATTLLARPYLQRMALQWISRYTQNH